MVLGKLDSNVKENQTGLFSHTIQKKHTKINSKWIKGVNVRPKTIKILKANIGSMLFDIHLTNIFLDMSP